MKENAWPEMVKTKVEKLDIIFDKIHEITAFVLEHHISLELNAKITIDQQVFRNVVSVG